jgi:hypothetical protein
MTISTAAHKIKIPAVVLGYPKPAANQPAPQTGKITHGFPDVSKGLHCGEGLGSLPLNFFHTGKGIL